MILYYPIAKSVAVGEVYQCNHFLCNQECPIMKTEIWLVLIIHAPMDARWTQCVDYREYHHDAKLESYHIVIYSHSPGTQRRVLSCSTSTPGHLLFLRASFSSLASFL